MIGPRRRPPRRVRDPVGFWSARTPEGTSRGYVLAWNLLDGGRESIAHGLAQPGAVAAIGRRSNRTCYTACVIATSHAHFPLSLVTLRGTVTIDDVNVLRAHYAVLHARGQRFVTLTDGRGVSVPNAAIRRAFADMSNDLADLAERNTICGAVLVDSTVLLGVVRAVLWLTRGNVKIRCFGAPMAAYGYLCTSLAAENLTMPAAGRAAIEAMGEPIGQGASEG